VKTSSLVHSSANGFPMFQSRKGEVLEPLLGGSLHGESGNLSGSGILVKNALGHSFMEEGHSLLEEVI